MALDHRHSGCYSLKILIEKFYVYAHTHIHYLNYFGLKYILDDKKNVWNSKIIEMASLFRVIQKIKFIRLKCPMCHISVAYDFSVTLCNQYSLLHSVADC